ncbi:uncharacterized protein C8Q71DRAFT_862978 [Rhodofomes roseus]|uniref:DUF6533 domain-containing protein n=1 Tax=Rhodofomes roseus TaxID=34475 RepID=A0ABQ8JZS9_9APHY|nr:uncharacterized protein C8Q71DRAFT_862978 [Rhodofomes roseus]KAH9829883.1 hypothetical protein C8Q71DRAFT_862978 [Rhodofomes roseus]
MLTLVARTVDADVLQTMKEQYILNYCTAAGTALLLYDYVVTLGQESRYIWKDIRAGYAAIFLVNRLIMLCMFIYGIFSICSGHTMALREVTNILGICFYQHIHDVGGCAYVLMLAWDFTLKSYAAVSALRVYAISNRTLSLAALTAALALMPAILNVFLAVNTVSYVESFGASTICDIDLTVSAQTDYE